MKENKSRNTIQSLKIGLSIIDVVVSAGKPLHISEIQEATEITKSNLYKYLNTLIQENWLYREKTTGLYHLGSKLIQYSAHTAANQDVIYTLTPYMQEISKKTGSTVLFAVPTVDGPVIAKIWNDNQIVINIGAETGALLPLKSAVGKIFYVFSDQAKHNQALQENLSKTVLSETEFEMIQREKIAFAKEPLISEVSSMAVPVLTQKEKLAGIIGVVGFSSHIPRSTDTAIIRYLQEMQKVVSEEFTD